MSLKRHHRRQPPKSMAPKDCDTIYHSIFNDLRHPFFKLYSLNLPYDLELLRQQTVLRRQLRSYSREEELRVCHILQNYLDHIRQAGDPIHTIILPRERNLLKGV